MLRIQVIAYYLDDLLIFLVQLPKTKDFLTPKTKGYSILKLKDGHARAWGHQPDLPGLVVKLAPREYA